MSADSDPGPVRRPRGFAEKILLAVKVPATRAALVAIRCLRMPAACIPRVLRCPSTSRDPGGGFRPGVKEGGRETASTMLIDAEDGLGQVASRAPSTWRWQGVRDGHRRRQRHQQQTLRRGRLYVRSGCAGPVRPLTKQRRAQPPVLAARRG
jgi:hypothetical protein